MKTISDPPPTSMSNSTPPEARGFVARVKASVTLLTAITGLVVATGAILKPRDDTATRESYDTLAKAVQEIGKENETQHDDLVALKAYVDGFVRGAGASKIEPTPASSGPAASTGSAPTPPALVSIAVVRTPPSPTLADKPKPVNPPTFREVREKAESR
jgi:hypothetical protein